MIANRFWVGGTGTWDSTSTTNWAATSGAASGASAPVAGDNVTFDANSGTGTITPNGTIAGIAFGSLTAGALTGGSTLAFNTNNPNVSFTTVSFTGTGTRTINMGSGTWTCTAGTGTVPFDAGTQTNLTPTFQNATLNLTGNGASRLLSLGVPSGGYGPVIIGDNSTKGAIAITGATTLASLTIGSGNAVTFTQGATLTITGALTINGTSSAPSALQSASPQSNVTTISVGSASTATWTAFLRVTESGAGTITATDSFDLGGNTNLNITAPSGGGGVVGVIGG